MSSNSTNIFEIISEGAISIVKCIASIISCVIAFVSLFRFADSIVGWLLALVNVKNGGFMVIIHKIRKWLLSYIYKVYLSFQ